MWREPVPYGWASRFVGPRHAHIGHVADLFGITPRSARRRLAASGLPATLRRYRCLSLIVRRRRNLNRPAEGRPHGLLA